MILNQNLAPALYREHVWLYIPAALPVVWLNRL